MPNMNIVMDAEGMMKGKPLPDYHVTNTITVGALAAGMTSGKPSVAILLTLPDGKTVFAETSMALFHAAARAFAARYGWQDR